MDEVASHIRSPNKKLLKLKMIKGENSLQQCMYLEPSWIVESLSQALLNRVVVARAAFVDEFPAIHGFLFVPVFHVGRIFQAFASAPFLKRCWPVKTFRHLINDPATRIFFEERLTGRLFLQKVFRHSGIQLFKRANDFPVLLLNGV